MINQSLDRRDRFGVDQQALDAAMSLASDIKRRVCAKVLTELTSKVRVFMLPLSSKYPFLGS